MNIVTATFSAGCTQIEADRKLWQYDQGQVLQLVGLDLPDSYQVEFSNSRDKGTAKAQIGGPDGVSIPDEYLTNGKPVYAFLVGHTAEEDRETEKLVVIYVNARSQPTDAPITPEQQGIVDQLIAALNAGVKKAEDAAEQAEAAIGYMPKIVDGDWWVYDAETETWADTGIQAEGQDGVGISGAVLNADYTLTLTFSDGTSYTTPSIRGPKGEDAPTDYILVQPTQPTSPTNRLWVDSDRGSTVQLPTMADHQALAEAVADNTEAIGDLSDELADQKSAFESHEQYAEETYAKQDGSYEDLTAGNAYELLSDRGDTNQQPYLFRQTGGDSSAYNREQLRKIVGGTVAWNQLSAPRTTTATINGVIVTPTDGTHVVLSGTSNDSGTLSTHAVVKTVENHVYACISSGTALTQGANLYTNIGGNYTAQRAFIRKETVGRNATCSFRTNANNTYTDATAYLFTCDLTQMFGTAIADYIYSLEQATDGAGVAFFRSLFPADYYDYNPGELMSVEGVSAHIMRDADNNIVGSYPLDSSLTLRGIPKLDSNNRMYYDGDVYEPDGTVTRKYRIVDLGTLNYIYNTTSSVSPYFAVNISDMARVATLATDIPNLICSAYTATPRSISKFVDKCTTTDWTGVVAQLQVKDLSYTNPVAFKTAMSGVMLVYELATPTTETAKPYRELQICDRDGTEEFVSTSIVPVGHETFYPVNVFDYIDRLTEPDADMIADSAIAANKYFSVGNRLFLSTASIAAGAQIIPGTNCTETSLAAALNALNA